MNTSFNSDLEDVPSMFLVYGDEPECNATIKYRRRVIDQKDPETPMKEIFMYDLSYPDIEKEKISVPKVYYEEEPRKNLPKWLRQELKRDKRDWKHIHRTIKRTPIYAPMYFSPLEEVPEAELTNQSYYCFDKPQNNEKNRQFQSSDENSMPSNNNQISSTRKNENANNILTDNEATLSQDNRQNDKASSSSSEMLFSPKNDVKSSLSSNKEHSSSGSNKENTFSASFEGSSFALSDE